jgi:Uma2 family endonuclease
MATFDQSNEPPPLRSGDRLSLAEFERRYYAMPNLKKADLIEGVVYTEPTVTCDHAEANADLICWMGFYSMATPHVSGSVRASTRLGPRSEVQPDALLLIKPKAGGQTRVGADGLLDGPPELVAEVTFNSASYDLHDKLDLYERSGVREYIAWRLEDEEVDWFVSRDGRFERLIPCRRGWLRSEFYPGLWLDTDALIRGRLNDLRDAVNQGLASPEHAAFVAKLLGASERR